MILERVKEAITGPVSAGMLFAKVPELESASRAERILLALEEQGALEGRTGPRGRYWLPAGYSKPIGELPKGPENLCLPNVVNKAIRHAIVDVAAANPWIDLQGVVAVLAKLNGDTDMKALKKTVGSAMTIAHQHGELVRVGSKGKFRYAAAGVPIKCGGAA